MHYRRAASLTLLSLFAAALLGGCANGPTRGASDQATTAATLPDALAPLPAQYAGTLPCGDCGSIAYWLTLGPDGDYILQQHYDTNDAQNPADYVEVGGWQLAADGRRLALTPADSDESGTSFWSISANGDLVALDENSQPITPAAQYTLHRRAHLDEPPLTGGRWYLVNAPDAHQGNAAYIAFDDDDKRLSGSTGCNRLMGDYERDDAALSLEHLAATKRACFAFEDTEQSMLEALRQTHRVRILGNYLLLLGPAGNASPLAVFQARSEAMPLSR
ncbi:META domain-containing protein [Salinisphaera sp. Q1T1-3]|uniref:META domain-containing protein n=1 Tax=Salinisphaera sp. Q1T1-3 TaxID=2321229 RepID=UPI001314D875|nr:META domain-containing protein [Salinisphaera sp. Q1T1-3]